MKCSDCARYKTRECYANPRGEDWDMAESYSCFEVASTEEAQYRVNEVIDDTQEEQTLGEMLLDGGSWQIHRGGIASRNRSILWQEVNEVYIGGLKTSINYIPAGEQMSITIVDYYKNRIRVTISGLFRMGTEKKNTFSDIYGYILHNIFDRQLRQAIRNIGDGKIVSFKAFNITSDGIYNSKGTRKLFGYKREYTNTKQSTAIGCQMHEGLFYIRCLQSNGKQKDKWIGDVKDIPNVHIAQALIEALCS
jgi:hypothetical protein